MTDMLTLEIDASAQAVQVWFSERYREQPNLTQGRFTEITLARGRALEFLVELRNDGITARVK